MVGGARAGEVKITWKLRAARQRGEGMGHVDGWAEQSGEGVEAKMTEDLQWRE